MAKKKRSDFIHKCGLGHAKANIEVVSHFIDSGPCIRSRRFLKGLFMVSDDHPHTKYYIRSINGKRRVQTYHLLHYYFMIHPLSKFALYRQFMMFFVLFGLYVILPFWMLILKSSEKNFFAILSFWQILFICEMIMTFFTGYMDESNRAILQPKKVAWNYLKTYLIFDVLSVLPYFAKEMYWFLDLKTVLKYWIVFLVLENCKLVRYFYWIGCYRLMMEYYKVPKTISITGRLLVKIVFIFALLFTISHNLEPFDVMLNMVEMQLLFFDNFYDVVVELLNVAHALKEMDWDITDKIINALYICIGFLFLLKLSCTFWEHLNKYFSSGFNETLTYEQYEAYASYTGISAELKNRIHVYLDFKYQGEYFKEHVIKDILSPELLKETRRTVSRSRLEKVKLFSSIPEELIIKLEERLFSDIYLAGDIIIKEGSQGRYLYFIVSGTVTVTSAAGEHICCLEDGANFGEIALILNQKRTTTIIAATPCELLVLKHSVYESVLNPYPEIIQCLKQEALSRLHATVETISEGPVCLLFDPGRTTTNTEKSTIVNYKDPAEQISFVNAIAMSSSLNSSSRSIYSNQPNSIRFDDDSKI